MSELGYIPSTDPLELEREIFAAIAELDRKTDHTLPTALIRTLTN